MVLNIGRLNKRGQIQSASESRDSIGGVSRTWSTVATRWMSLEPIKGQEFYSAQQVNSQVTHHIRMRAPEGFTLTPAHRIVIDSRTFHVEQVRDVMERHHELDVMAVEVV